MTDPLMLDAVVPLSFDDGSKLVDMASAAVSAPPLAEDVAVEPM